MQFRSGSDAVMCSPWGQSINQEGSQMNRLQRGPRPDPVPVHYMLNRSAWLRTLERGEKDGAFPPGRFDQELLKMELIPPGVEVIPVIRETFRLVWGRRTSVKDINRTGEYLDEKEYFKKS